MLNPAQMKRNNLDSLFKEKLKDFSEIPDERIWDKLEASLAKRKKKRIVPIWWQLGGAAAAIAILFYLINPFSSAENTVVPTVVDTQEHIQDNPQNTEDNTLESLKPVQQSKETPLVDSERPTGNGIKSKEQNTISPASKNVAHPQRDQSIPSEAIAVNTQEKGEQKDFNKLTDPNKGKDPITVKNGEMAENHVTPKNPNEIEKNGQNENKMGLLEGETQEVAQNENEEEKSKISIYDAIEAQEELEQEAVAVSQKEDRWSMGPSVAPIFFSSTGEGSPIHSDFASNNKSGNLNLSYGLTVTYNISEKLSVRSGVHKVDFGYDTNDVFFSSSLTTSSNELIDNISYTRTSRNLVVESKSSRSTTVDNAEFSGDGISQFKGQMVQQLGYIEVPMELNYALVDRRFGVNLIGGLSSLFLVDNSISVESDQLVTEVGEANNANSVNFSTNIGIGFNYEISKKVEFNVEPIFKYQLNTFSDTAGDFRPFAVGVYSGLNFRF